MSSSPHLPPPQTNDAGQMYIYSMLARLDERQENMQRDLLGNGQPGRVQRLEAETKTNKEDIGWLKGKMFYFLGAASMLGAFIAPAIKVGFEGLLKLFMK